MANYYRLFLEKNNLSISKLKPIATYQKNISNLLRKYC